MMEMNFQLAGAIVHNVYPKRQICAISKSYLADSTRIVQLTTTVMNESGQIATRMHLSRNPNLSRVCITVLAS